MDGIVSKIHKHKPIKKITDDIEKIGCRDSKQNPRKDYGGLPFFMCSLRVL